MREILFKAKRVDNGEWVEGDLIQYSQTETKILEPFFRQWDILEGGHDVDPSTVCQYTGVKDKNGVKIFEGDKLVWKGAKDIEMKIEYQQAQFKLIGKHWSQDTSMLSYHINRLFITGNIHDNDYKM